MIPVITLVGRPNVGKSTLFNRLTHSRNALVADLAGVTRDRQYGRGCLAGRAYLVVDTGGMIDTKHVNTHRELHHLLTQQIDIAIAEADVILWMVDAQDGIMAEEVGIAQQLRRTNKPIYLVVNKTDGVPMDHIRSDCHALGFANTHYIAALRGKGVTHLTKELLDLFPATTEDLPSSPLTPNGIQLAIIGRPNVGKSTLTNRVLGEERMIVSDQPGTTRDSIYIPFLYHHTHYLLIDTAGVRRRPRITQAMEKFSAIKTLKTIATAHVAILLINAQEDIAEQDLRLAKFVIDAGKALVIAINKWDGLTAYQRNLIKKSIDRRLTFAQFAEVHFISALHGFDVNHLFTAVNTAYHAATRTLPTPQLTNILQAAITAHPPPLINSKRVKLRYAHAGGSNPPLIVIHGKHLNKLPSSYQRYLVNAFRKQLKLIGTPLHLKLTADPA